MVGDPNTHRMDPHFVNRYFPRTRHEGAAEHDRGGMRGAEERECGGEVKGGGEDCMNVDAIRGDQFYMRSYLLAFYEHSFFFFGYPPAPAPAPASRGRRSFLFPPSSLLASPIIAVACQPAKGDGRCGVRAGRRRRADGPDPPSAPAHRYSTAQEVLPERSDGVMGCSEVDVPEKGGLGCPRWHCSISSIIVTTIDGHRRTKIGIEFCTGIESGTGTGSGNLKRIDVEDRTMTTVKSDRRIGPCVTSMSMGAKRDHHLVIQQTSITLAIFNAAAAVPTARAVCRQRPQGSKEINRKKKARQLASNLEISNCPPFRPLTPPRRRPPRLIPPRYALAYLRFGRRTFGLTGKTLFDRRATAVEVQFVEAIHRLINHSHRRLSV
ncbi:hypothetical protein EVAR_29972_1 [Eumeta japonica]|uniref:Uncharacterized protein n=1 Tax=Eumeta variegata TaxID=151549 RepID=A0A4C1VGM1_EUMVA|nr:hypothetical protein EVAR_29972_1 [Eumeta japonica]